MKEAIVRLNLLIRKEEENQNFCRVSNKKNNKANEKINNTIRYVQ